MIQIRSTLAAVLMMGAAAVASAQQPATTPGTLAQHGARAHAAGRPGAKLQKQLFRGITLSAAEKANIKSVHAKYAPQMKALHERYKPQNEAMRQARQRGDTAAVRAMWDKSSVERTQTKQLLQAERNDLRAALAQGNQAKFDANAATLEKRMARRPDGKNGLQRPGGPRV